MSSKHLMIFYFIFCLILVQGYGRIYSQDIEEIPIEITDEITGETAEDDDGTEKTKVPAEGKYLQMAVGYIHEKKYDQARRYIQLAQESGDEKIYQDTVVWALYLDSLEGKKNPDSALNSLQGDMNSKANYYISEGWQTYFEKNPEARDVYALSIEYKEKLIARDPDSEWALLATMQLVPVYINEKHYDKALNYLLDYLDRSRKQGKVAETDKYWFYLGQILENSKEYRDLHKAIKSYQMVVNKPDSYFYDQAKNRISEIEKLYNIIP